MKQNKKFIDFLCVSINFLIKFVRHSIRNECNIILVEKEYNFAFSRLKRPLKRYFKIFCFCLRGYMTHKAVNKKKKVK